MARVINGLLFRALKLDGESLDVSLPDPKDIVFYEVTMSARKEADAYLVTGNLRHFPTRHFIVTPREMLDLLEK